MAFVILSARALARSKTRTISVRLFLGIVTAALSTMLAVGLMVGWMLNQPSADAGEMVQAPPAVMAAAPAANDVLPQPATTAAGDNRALVERIGELSGRIVQLELEAEGLAARIDAVKEFESRMKVDDGAPAGRVAKTQPGAPSGGPLLAPEDEVRRGGGSPDTPAGSASASATAGHSPLTEELARVQQDVERLTQVLADLDRLATTMNLAHMSFPGRAPVVDVAITSSFGNRLDPFRKRRAFHSGVDFPAPRGTPIHASAGGKVIFAAYRREYGHTIEIDHGAGLVTRYAHASKLIAKEGQVVMPGQLIAEIGSSGRSTGPHLHFEILKDGRFVDPSIYLARF